jgi:hypothetical protein
MYIDDSSENESEFDEPYEGEEKKKHKKKQRRDIEEDDPKKAKKKQKAEANMTVVTPKKSESPTSLVTSPRGTSPRGQQIPVPIPAHLVYQPGTYPTSPTHHTVSPTASGMYYRDTIGDSINRCI